MIPREKTPKEIREEFLRYAWTMVGYWERVEGAGIRDNAEVIELAKGSPQVGGLLHKEFHLLDPRSSK